MKRKSKLNVNFGFLRFVIFAVLAVVFLAFAGQAVWTYLKTSPLFRIKTVVVSDPSMQFIKASRLVNLKGRNIFDLDLRPLAKRLQAQYPEIAEIKLSKRFPDQIVVLTKKRIAFAQARIKNKDITIDREGVILSMGLSISPAQDIPLIAGVNSEKVSISPGNQLKSPEIKTALSLIKAFRANKYLSIYKILKIDAGNLSQIEFYMTENFKGIIDQENIPGKIQILAMMLSQAKLKPEEINYIDLRFKEPIIGKKIGDKK